MISSEISSRNREENHLKFDILHKDKTWIRVNLPIVEGTSRTVAPDRNVFANDFALFPFVIIGKYFGNADVRRTLLV